MPTNSPSLAPSTAPAAHDSGPSAALPIVAVIPTHGRPMLLGRTLDSVLACTAPPGRAVRLIVAENGPRAGAEALVASKSSSWLTPEYRHSAAANKSAALNAVLQELPDCLMLLFDDDIRVEPSILCRYAEASGTARGGYFYGGGVLVDYEAQAEPPPWLLAYLPVSAQGWQPSAGEYRGVTDQLAFLGCNWAAFASDVRAAGGFDHRFGPGGTSGGTGQERAMQIRLRERGVMPRYLPHALVWHYVPQSRCSPRWALDRTYRNAIRAGHELRVEPGTARIAGVPWPLARRALHQGWSVARHWIGDDAPSRHRRLDTLMGTLGRIKGIRERRGGAGR
ncbi:MAG: glycosyltransferase [Burkholderiaceae bacterium]|nr:glycosyltransferase [Burkholderiaceae bacterium]